MAPHHRTPLQARNLEVRPLPDETDATIANAAPPLKWDPDLYGGYADPNIITEYEAQVLGVWETIRLNFDPDTYDPNAPRPWMPEPDGPEEYAAWGKQHFGKEWFDKREKMIAERNLYAEHDRKFYARQRELRILEHQVERRPFRPIDDNIAYDLESPVWKRIWARYKHRRWNTPPSTPIQDVTPPLPNSVARDDSKQRGSSSSSNDDHDLPVPNALKEEGSGRPVPSLDDPWGQIEWFRKEMKWDNEHYMFERVFVHEELLDQDRADREDEAINARKLEKRQMLETLRTTDPAMYALELRHFEDHETLSKQGWDVDEITTFNEARMALYTWHRSNPEPVPTGPDGDWIDKDEYAAYLTWGEELKEATSEVYAGLPGDVHLPPYPWLPEIPEDKYLVNLWHQFTHNRRTARWVRRSVELQAARDTDADTAESRRLLDRLELSIDNERRNQEVFTAANLKAYHARVAHDRDPARPRKDSDEFEDPWKISGFPTSMRKIMLRLHAFGEERLSSRLLLRPKMQAKRERYVVEEHPPSFPIPPPNPIQPPKVKKQEPTESPAMGPATPSPSPRKPKAPQETMAPTMEPATPTPSPRKAKEKLLSPVLSRIPAAPQPEAPEPAPSAAPASATAPAPVSWKRPSSVLSLPDPPSPQLPVIPAPVPRPEHPKKRPKLEKVQKVQKKGERMSRRLAGKLPEYGPLLGNSNTGTRLVSPEVSGSHKASHTITSPLRHARVQSIRDAEMKEG